MYKVKGKNSQFTEKNVHNKKSQKLFFAIKLAETPNNRLDPMPVGE